MSDQRGFSLIELLVAMAAAALLLVTLASVTGGLAARARNNDRTAPLIEEARAGAALAALVARAVPTDQPTAIMTDEGALRFPILGDRGDAQSVALTVVNSDQVLEAALQDRQGRTIAGSEELLIEGARAISITAPIVGASNGDRRLSRVEIHVTRTDGSQYSLAASPRITARPGCRFDAISLECRPQ